MTVAKLELLAIPGLPMIKAGDDLAALLAEGFSRAGLTPQKDDVLALALTPEEKMSVEDPVEMQRLADALPVERAASRWIVSNDPDEVVEKVGGYVGLGFKHLVFHAPGPDQPRFLKLFAEQVAPRMRKKFG